MSAEAEELCRSCGFCCDGTLFARVRLADGEDVTGPRLDVVVDERGRWLRQPCGALDGLDCSMYADRPGTCRTYRCDLLGALGEGEVSLAEARVVVEKTRAATGEERRFLLRHHFTGWR